MACSHDTEPVRDDIAARAAVHDRFNRLFHLAVRENNAGVDSYNDGDFVTSFRHLYHALKCMQDFTQYHEAFVAGKTEAEAAIRSSGDLHHHHRHHHHPQASGPLHRAQDAFKTGGFERQQTQIPINHTPDPRAFGTDHSTMQVTGGDESMSSGGGETSALPTRDRNDRLDGIGLSIDLEALYRCALYLRCSGDSLEAFVDPLRSCLVTDLARIRASVLFNLGLAHHTQAAMIAPDAAAASTELERAVLLYQLCLEVQESEWAPISHLYLMAVCNNLGQCSASLRRHSVARSWHERLLGLMVCHREMQQQQQQQNHHRPTDDPDEHAGHHPSGWECFVRNTMPLILRDPAVSPAA